MSDCKPKPTPCILGFETTTNEDSEELTDPKLYRAIVGSLIDVMTGTRPDLCYVVIKLSQKMSKPTPADLGTAKHVLRYLKGTQELGLTFKRSVSPLNFEGFCDSDWGGKHPPQIGEVLQVTTFSYLVQDHSSHGKVVNNRLSRCQHVKLNM